MTNDQKLLLLISKCDELLKTLDKLDAATLYSATAKKQRKDLAIWIGINKLVTTAKTPPVRKRPNTFNHNQNWLEQ
jgi:hypothetical protein